MKLWTNGSLHVQLAPVARPRIPASLRVFEGGTLVRSVPAGGDSVDVDVAHRRIFVCMRRSISNKPSLERTYDLDSLAVLDEREVEGLHALAWLGAERRGRVVRRTDGFVLAVTEAGDVREHPLVASGETRDARNGKTQATSDVRPMQRPQMTHTPWGVSIGDGHTGRVGTLREGGFSLLPWQFPASDEMELVARATERGHLVVARRAGRDSTVWYVTDSDARPLLDNAYGAYAVGVGDDLCLVFSNDTVIALELSTGKQLAKSACSGVLTGAAGASGCMILATSGGLREVRWRSGVLTTEVVTVLRYYDLAARFTTMPNDATCSELSRGIASSIGTSQEPEGALITLSGVASEMVEEARNRLTAAGAVSIAQSEAPA